MDTGTSCGRPIRRSLGSVLCHAGGDHVIPGWRSAVIQNVRQPHDEVFHLLTPAPGGNRLELALRLPKQVYKSIGKNALARAAEHLQAMADGYKAHRGTSQPPVSQDMRHSRAAPSAPSRILASTAPSGTPPVQACTTNDPSQPPAHRRRGAEYMWFFVLRCRWRAERRSASSAQPGHAISSLAVPRGDPSFS